jgi:hypothetical protein
VNCELSAWLECGIIDGRRVEKTEDDLGRVAGRNWAGTLLSPNSKPVRMAADDEMWSIALGEWTVPATVALQSHDESNENTRLVLVFIHRIRELRQRSRGQRRAQARSLHRRVELQD